ncbi:uncharacterized protein JN550_006550 [Neoarthrinium moseri]|uniref:uncharacterized protein n=1 Tax=Neoarthrinium moseri TaxID=1658444 RepID=UPI001FDDA7A9|nr:uncharacterized protein JN550_006550 [Neoarthrinium moseri]KAI1868062.1 hypothetical protein JN550_006550 [Neoarthrinium moseri]
MEKLALLGLLLLLLLDSARAESFLGITFWNGVDYNLKPAPACYRRLAQCYESCKTTFDHCYIKERRYRQWSVQLGDPWDSCEQYNPEKHIAKDLKLFTSALRNERQDPHSFPRAKDNEREQHFMNMVFGVLAVIGEQGRKYRWDNNSEILPYMVQLHNFWSTPVEDLVTHTYNAQDGKWETEKSPRAYIDWQRQTYGRPRTDNSWKGYKKIDPLAVAELEGLMTQSRSIIDHLGFLLHEFSHRSGVRATLPETPWNCLTDGQGSCKDYLLGPMVFRSFAAPRIMTFQRIPEYDRWQTSDGQYKITEDSAHLPRPDLVFSELEEAVRDGSWDSWKTY